MNIYSSIVLKLYSIAWLISSSIVLAGSCTVSGVSSGAAMATQFHVSHSSVVSGVGIIAGPPYWCANLDIAYAVTACTKIPALISVTELQAATDYGYATLSIDNPALLATSKVYLFSGIKDTVVDQGVVKKNLEYYQKYVPSSSIKAVFNISAEHAVITANYGNPCIYLGSPYINNCGYDQTGDMLAQLLGKLNPRSTANIKNLLEFDQRSFIPIVGPDFASMADNGYVYIPTACNSSSAGCIVHLALHGCLQYAGKVGDAFYNHAGYNEWAESNKIIVIYPQTKSTFVNPEGCWDWWGYTGTDFATKLAVQIATLKNMVDHFSPSI